MPDRWVRHDVGSDGSGDGLTEATAWKTLNKAISVVAATPNGGAGYVIKCKGGPLGEEVNIQNGGVNGNSLKIRVPAGETFTIDGDYSYPAGVTDPGVSTPWGTTLDSNWKGLLVVAANHVSINDDDDGTVGSLSLLDSLGVGFEVQHPTGANGGRYQNIIFKNATITGARRQTFSISGVNGFRGKNLFCSGAGNFATFHRPVGQLPNGLNHPAATTTKYSDDVQIENFYSSLNWGEGIIIGNNTRNWRFKNLRCFNNSHVNIYVHHAAYGVLDTFMAYQEDVTPSNSLPSDWASGLIFDNEDYRADWGPPNQLENCNHIEAFNGLIYGCRRGMGFGAGDNGLFGFNQISLSHIHVINPKDSRVDDSPATNWVVNNNSSLSGIEVTNCLFHHGNVYSGVGYTHTLASAPSNPGISYRNNAWSAQPIAAVRGPNDIYGDLRLDDPDALISGGGFASAIDQFKSTENSPHLARGIWRGATLDEGILKDIEGVTRPDPPDIGAFQGTAGPPPPTNASASIGVDYETSSTAGGGSPGQVNLTDATALGGKTPKGFLVISNGATLTLPTTTPTIIDHAKISIGLGSTPGTIASISARDTDADPDSEGRTWGNTLSAAHLIGDSGLSLVHQLDYSGVAADTLTLYKPAAQTVAAGILAWIAAGDNVDVATSTTTMLSGTDVTNVISNLAWQPNLWFFLGYPKTFDNTQYNQVNFSFGIATGAGNQFCFSYQAYNQDDPTSIQAELFDDRIYHNLATGVNVNLFAVASNGFTLKKPGSSQAAQTLAWQAARYNGVDLYLDNVAMPASTGVQTVATFGWEAQAVFVLQTMLSAINTLTTDGKAGAFGFGMANHGAQYFAGWNAQDAAATTNTKSIMAPRFLYLPQHDGTDGIFTGTGMPTFTSTALTADFTNALARQAIVLAVRQQTVTAGSSSRAKKRILRQGMAAGLRAGF